ncbi:DNA-directed RNA polymerase subunit RPC12/RpoP [Clostridium pascui]|uniref:hypothetical protein n=1 Tax=Clostridium pascui TaxID=46609 RepID=UPI00195A446F|nr:hypothetical protein [Clostridium pascui]MBM7868908.1 DNA-directed RNA polymerase subunit RPC12/RpoP [Clostridium pascui]
MGAKNRVIDGAYKDKGITITSLGVIIMIGIFKKIILDENTVSAYEVYDSEKTISASSAIGKAVLGEFFYGPVGLVAAASAEKKGIYIIAVQFKDGKRSLLEVDEKIYNRMLLIRFQNECKSAYTKIDNTQNNNIQGNIYCQNCGQEVTGKFCSNCGTENNNIQDISYCQNCGQEVTGKFCSNCGTQINSLHEQEKLIPNNEIIDVNGIELDMTQIVNKYGKNKILAIKYVASLTGISLKESIKIVDDAYQKLDI